MNQEKNTIVISKTEWINTHLYLTIVYQEHEKIFTINIQQKLYICTVHRVFKSVYFPLKKQKNIGSLY